MTLNGQSANKTFFMNLNTMIAQSKHKIVLQKYIYFRIHLHSSLIYVQRTYKGDLVEFDAQYITTISRHKMAS